jgi:hypothetical protein
MPVGLAIARAFRVLEQDRQQFVVTTAPASRHR